MWENGLDIDERGGNQYRTPDICCIGYCVTRALAKTSGTIETWEMESEYQ